MLQAKFIFAVVDRIYHGCCVQHCLEALDMTVDFFIIYGKMGGGGDLIKARALWANVL
jgi:hypothetical protein